MGSLMTRSLQQTLLRVEQTVESHFRYQRGSMRGSARGSARAASRAVEKNTRDSSVPEYTSNDMDHESKSRALAEADATDLSLSPIESEGHDFSDGILSEVV